MRRMRLLAAPDKFRGTLTAHMAAAAIAAGAAPAGWEAVELPLADGGEGTLDVLGGGNRSTTVTGPLREPVVAAWRLEEDGTALIEAARACGLSLAGGPHGEETRGAATRGVRGSVRGTIPSARRAAVSGSSSRRPSRKARGGSSSPWAAWRRRTAGSELS